MLTQLTFWFCFAGAVSIACLPAARAGLARSLALGFTLASGLCALAVFLSYPSGGAGFTDVISLSWIPSLGIRFSTGVDGIGACLLLMTGIVSVASVLMSWNVTTREKEFFTHMLILTGAVYGVFVSLDLFLLFVFYEISIIPKYFLIALWGGQNRQFAAMKLVLYSFLGSLVALLGLLIVHVGHFQATGLATFDLRVLSANAALLPAHLQFVCLPLFFIGFGILAGLWPFHTWAPTGHTAAPTAASMLLAGVIMKLGAYGALRLGVGVTGEGLFLPAHIAGVEIAHFWMTVFAAAGVIAIVLGAGSSLIQKDLKFVVAYSSISHMGFVIVGLALAGFFGLTGAILQMISHGFIAALLFACVGRMIYDRTHSRRLEELPAFELKRRLPLVCAICSVAFIASAGMPGFSGFIAEFTVFRGLIERSVPAALLVALGVLVTFAYSLKVLHILFWQPAPFRPAHEPILPTLSPLTIQEKAAAALLIAAIVWLGLLPGVFTGRIAPNLPAVPSALTNVALSTEGGRP
ncbi:NADH-quinone oxidoreductase subunit M [Oscillatoria laete-virens NRMC-F 0139]|nr:NADH-quinone oxidoreductase subunit M [Oscillatoria laete-virens]MDL5054725.1 NADH-quinone oxidoreductase subunit M [Oscillatoria laete-virens NRMC-F 0139]